MSNINKALRIIVLSLFTMIFLFISAFAEDYSTPHTLYSGDVISADMMNELFDKVKDTNKSITASDLLGTWTCDAYNSSGLADDAVTGWVISEEEMCIKLSGVTITFADDGDGTFSFSTSAPSPIRITYSNTHTSPYVVVADTLLFKSYNTSMDNEPYNISYGIEKVSDTRIVLKREWAGACPYDARILICDKQALPPNKPTRLSASSSGLVVTLTWTDNSSDETGFKIMRKDTLTGEYSEIATTDADATTYEDTVTAAGKYWYRVRATNSNGDSLGSNVAKVTVSE